MRIAVAGSTGFLGRALMAAFRGDGHDVVGLTRRTDAGPGEATWRPDGSAGSWVANIDGADAIVNLAGESLAGQRWTGAYKARIRDSRILPTRSLVRAIQQSSRRPRLLLNGSAIGYYGSRGDEVITEESGPGTGFLSDVCVAWESEAARAEAAGTRVVLLRTGVVLSSRGGALQQMLRPFKLFVGGPLGSGRQYMSWIHRDDWVALVRWLLGTKDSRGAFNLTAPEPLTNAELTTTVARALHRPAFMRAPAFALKLALGEMAEPLLLNGQRVLPARALAAGFTFKYPRLHEALGETLGTKEQNKKQNT